MLNLHSKQLLLLALVCLLPSIAFLHISTPYPVPNCNDGIQNNGETGVDCGGPNCSPCPCETTVTLTIKFDRYPEETSWTITNNGGTIASGGTYASEPIYSTLSIPDICVDLRCFTFTMLDSEGDGICCGFGNGSYTLTHDLDGSILASGGTFTTTDVTDFCIDGVSLTPKVYLQGPYNGTDMNADLGGAIVPTTSPYGDGATTTAAVINAYDIVDWVEVELLIQLFPGFPFESLAERSALLKKNGTVVHTDGYTPVTFPRAIYPNIVDGYYHVAIKHRNHLGVMTTGAPFSLD